MKNPLLPQIKALDAEMAALKLEFEAQFSIMEKKRERLIIANEVNQELGIYSEHVESDYEDEPVTHRHRIQLLFMDKKEMSVNEVHEKLTNEGVEVSRATVNTTLYNMAKKGILERTESGYKRL